MKQINSPLNSTHVKIFVFLLFLQACAAYSIGPVPLQWIAQAGIVLLFLWLFLRRHIRVFTSFHLLMIFLMWTLGVTLANMLSTDYSVLVPPLATTPYLVYVSLRIFTLVTFIATVGITYWLMEANQGETLIRRCAYLGVIVAIYGFYVYLAQVKGWPEIPRTRVGTTGREQITVFSYAFHRAMGSFREPSHLAEWLILPLFFSLSLKSWKGILLPLIIGSVLLLTGSLTGILSSLFGISVAALFAVRRLIPESARGLKYLIPIVIAGIVFSLLVVKNNDGSGNLVEVLWKRVEPLLSEKGAEASNRDYVYHYISHRPIPVVGVGLGHSNLVFSKSMRIEATASFLNLYINIAYSLGLIGLGLFIWLIIYPFFIFIRNSGHRPKIRAFFVTGAYMAWLVTFFAHSEELSVHFGIIYAMALYIFGQKVEA